jgi:hypothetical protein
MPVPILYVEVFPDIAAVTVGAATNFPSSAGGSSAERTVFADDGTATHISVLTTVGGILTIGSITLAGSGLTAGTYPNVPLQGPGQGSLTIVVNADGTVHAGGATSFNPGYGYAANSGVSPTAAGMATIGTSGSTPPVFSVGTVIPCSAPFPPNTKYIEISCDANGPAFFDLDSTLSSNSITNTGLLTTQEGVFTTCCSRINKNERLVRRIPWYTPTAGNIAPLTLQVIMSTQTKT